MIPLGPAAGGGQSPQDTARPLQTNGTSSTSSVPNRDGTTKTYIHRLKSSASNLILENPQRTHRPKSLPSSGLSRRLSAAGSAAKAVAKTTFRRSQDLFLRGKSVRTEPDGALQLSYHATPLGVDAPPAAASKPDRTPSSIVMNSSSSLSAEVGQKRKHPDDNVDLSSHEAPKPKSRITGSSKIFGGRQSIGAKVGYSRDRVTRQESSTWPPDRISVLEPNSRADDPDIERWSDGQLPPIQQTSPPLQVQRQNLRSSASTGQAANPRTMTVTQEAQQNCLNYSNQQSKPGFQHPLPLYPWTRRPSSQTNVSLRSDSFLPASPSSGVLDYYRPDSEVTLTTNAGTMSDSIRWSNGTSMSNITNATIPESLFAQTKRSHPDSRANSLLSRPSISPQSSIPNIGRARTRVSLEADGYGEKSLPPIPAFAPTINEVPVDISFDDLSQFIVAAGNHAQQRRQVFPTQIIRPPVVSEITGAPDSSLSLGSCLVSKECHDTLSIINEHALEPESPKVEHLLRQDDGEMTDGELCLESAGEVRDRERSERQVSETATLASHRATDPSSNTSVTSIGDSPQSEGLSLDFSDDDTASDFSDHTDVSLLDTFYSHPAPFGLYLLLFLFNIKEAVVASIRQHVDATSHQNDEERHHNENPTPSTSTSTVQNSGSQPLSSKGAGNSKRRLRGDEEDDEPGRGDRDDEKRRKPNSAAQVTRRPPPPPRKLACPFCKRYIRRDWLVKSCYGPGWETTNRVREHVRRRHGVPFKCARCHSVFKTDAERKTHAQAAVACKPPQPPVGQEITCIDQGKDKELRKRARNNSGEKERWENMYRIIFPGEIVPSPYQDDGLEAPRPDASTIALFRGFMVGPLLRSIVNALSDHPHVIQINEAAVRFIQVAIETCFDNRFSLSRDRQGRSFPAPFSPVVRLNGSNVCGEVHTQAQNHDWVDSQMGSLQLLDNMPTNLVCDRFDSSTRELMSLDLTASQPQFSPRLEANTPSPGWMPNTNASNFIRSQDIASFSPSRPQSIDLYDLPDNYLHHTLNNPLQTSDNTPLTAITSNLGYEGISSDANTAMFDFGLQNQMATLHSSENSPGNAHMQSDYMLSLSAVGGGPSVDLSRFGSEPTVTLSRHTTGPDAGIEEGYAPQTSGILVVPTTLITSTTTDDDDDNDDDDTGETVVYGF